MGKNKTADNALTLPLDKIPPQQDDSPSTSPKTGNILSPRVSPKEDSPKSKTSPRVSPRLLLFFKSSKISKSAAHIETHPAPFSPKTEDNGLMSPRVSGSYAALKDVPPSRSLPNSVHMGNSESAAAVETQQKKVNFVKLRPSLKLKALIPQDAMPELWRKTLTYKVQYDQNLVRLREFESYLWHTKSSLQSMCSLRALQEVQKLQKQMLNLFSRLYGEIFDPAFQLYLDNHPDEVAQTEAFCNFLRETIETVMDNSFLKELPLSEDKSKVLPEFLILSAERQNELYSSWYKFRAEVVLTRLKFYESEINSHIDSIAPYIATQIDPKQCTQIIDELKTLCQKVSNARRNADMAIAESLMKLAKNESLAEHCSLLQQLPSQGNFNKDVIAKITGILCNQQSCSARRQYAKCTQEDTDLFIPSAGQMQDNITQMLIQFGQEHKTLFNRPEFSISPRKDKLSSSIRNTLIEKISEDLVKLMQPQEKNYSAISSNSYRP